MSLGSEQYSAFPEGMTELRLDVDDQPDQDLLCKFEEVYDFLGMSCKVIMIHLMWYVLLEHQTLMWSVKNFGGLSPTHSELPVD